jgi:hypothetical protein
MGKPRDLNERERMSQSLRSLDLLYLYPPKSPWPAITRLSQREFSPVGDACR